MTAIKINGRHADRKPSATSLTMNGSDEDCVVKHGKGVKVVVDLRATNLLTACTYQPVTNHPT